MFGDDTSAGAPTDETLSSLSAAAATPPDPFDPATYDNVTVTGDPSKDDDDSTSAFFTNLGATPAAAATKENEVFGPEDFAPYPEPEEEPGFFDKAIQGVKNLGRFITDIPK